MGMKKMTGLIGSTLCGILLATGVGAAQVSPSVSGSNQLSTRTSVPGDLERLSPEDQKVARALFEAQYADTISAQPKALTLNEIAAMRVSGQGWAGIFEDMRSRGLVRQPTLDLVISRFESPQGASPQSSASWSVKGSDRTQADVNQRVEVGASPGVGRSFGAIPGGGASISGGLGARSGLGLR